VGVTASHLGVLLSPSPGQDLLVRELPDDSPVVVDSLGDDRFAFATEPGVTYQVSCQSRREPAADAPVITQQQSETSVELPNPASFAVIATGKDLKFQWQKNRDGISGANGATYTTPPTTLWELGSQYRCVILNRAGVTISEPARLNPEAAGNRLAPGF